MTAPQNTTGKCTEYVLPRYAAGLSRGRHSTGSLPHECGKPAAEGDTLCTTHAAKRDAIRTALAARKS